MNHITFDPADSWEKFIPIIVEIYSSLSDDGKFRFLACAGNLQDQYQKPIPGSGKVIQFPTGRVNKTGGDHT